MTDDEYHKVLDVILAYNKVLIDQLGMCAMSDGTAFLRITEGGFERVYPVSVTIRKD